VSVVELHAAFMWHCPYCGKEYFERAVRVEDPEKQEIPLGEPEVFDYDWWMAPATVSCRNCKRKFETENS
jgi:hypothetical protein